MKTIKEVFDHHLRDMVFDNQFVKQVKNFQHYFLTKNDDHLHFFAEPLVGVYNIKWTTKETDMWWSDICQVDEDEVTDDYLAVPDVNPKFEISGKAINVLFLYLIHRVETSSLIKEKDKIDCKLALMSILQYKFLTSIHSNNFRLVLADKSIALETYNQLDNKFDLKRAKSWKILLEERGSILIDERGVYGRIIQRFDENKRIIDMVNDVKGRLNKSMVAIMRVFYDVKEKGDRIHHTSSTLMLEDLVVKDLSRQQSSYIRYIQRIASNPETFIKKELRDVIVSSMKAIDEDFFDQVLIFFSQNFDNTKFKYLHTVVDDVINYTFDFMREENLSTRDSFVIATRIRQNFMSGRANDGKVMEARKLVDKMIHTYNPKTKRMVITSERVSLMMYIVLRALFMHHYQD
jgi:hypothetical protein|nr:MAG TPA: hypothetical protein [Caudoviricetes sp.]